MCGLVHLSTRSTTITDYLLTDCGQPTNHLDLEGLDGLMLALSTWNGGVIVISHDERFITSVAREVRDFAVISYLSL